MFLFHAPSLVCKVKYISKKNVFVPWVISEFTYFPQKIVFKSNLKAYYKVRQLIYYKVRQVLQSVIPLELIKSNRDSVRKAREAYLIDRGQTIEPLGLNRRDET